MKKLFVKIILILICIAMLAMMCACGQKENEAHKQMFAMDTIMTLTVYGPKADKGLAEASNVISELDATLDPQNDSSPVFAMNNAGGVATKVPKCITDMLETAQTVYERTNGALDLTVYPLSELWGFIDLDNGGEGRVPTQAEIDRELSRLAFEQIRIDGNSVTLPSTAKISFGSIAKGYTSDSIVEAIRQQGVESAIVSLGGNVQTLGLKPDGTKWNVAIEDPNDTSQFAGILSVGETAVITSGSYQRFFEKDGTRYHHIIDPHTGYPADSDLKSVSIVCESGVMADCLSTAMFVIGAEAALDYWRTYGGFEMIMITTDNRIMCTKGLDGDFQLANSNYELTYVK